MPLARVQISEDKADFIKSLKDSDSSNSPFQTYADILQFAAMIGFYNDRRITLGRFSRKDPDAVPQDQLRDKFIIDLVAITESQDLSYLQQDNNADWLRTEIFQEYVNGGLEILMHRLTGSVDYTDILLLILKDIESRSNPLSSLQND